VHLAVPFILAFRFPACARTPRKRRDIDIDTPANRRVSFDPHVYIDAIGVPRGVPNEFKARNQTESVLFWWSTVNKNVNWINYIYYSQQRFVNYTRDAIKGIAEQLGQLARMAWENRLSLDMMLAKKGGVCIMISISCCTYITNNTAPDGTITKALQGLTTLANKLAENSGINDPFTDLMENWFGRWKGWMSSILTSLM
jgi:hypothetical protein